MIFLVWVVIVSAATTIIILFHFELNLSNYTPPVHFPMTFLLVKFLSIEVNSKLLLVLIPPLKGLGCF